MDASLLSADEAIFFFIKGGDCFVGSAEDQNRHSLLAMTFVFPLADDQNRQSLLAMTTFIQSRDPATLD
jgi:hypothetical protein